MKKYPAAHLLFTDTDSLMYHVETLDIYKELFEDKQLFDNAGYPDTSPFFDASNNKVIGKFKDETNGKPIKEFVGLRPKMYSFLVHDNGKEVEKHRAKGIKKVASDSIRHAQFKSQLDTPEENYQINPRIACKLHKIYTVEVCFIRFHKVSKINSYFLI